MLLFLTFRSPRPEDPFAAAYAASALVGAPGTATASAFRASSNPPAFNAPRNFTPMPARGTASAPAQPTTFNRSTTPWRSNPDQRPRGASVAEIQEVYEPEDSEDTPLDQDEACEQEAEQLAQVQNEDRAKDSA